MLFELSRGCPFKCIYCLQGMYQSSYRKKSIEKVKKEIKRAVERLYEVKVISVNLLITSEGVKKAYVKLSPDNKASDLAIRLGIL